MAKVSPDFLEVFRRHVVEGLIDITIKGYYRVTTGTGGRTIYVPTDLLEAAYEKKAREQLRKLGLEPTAESAGKKD